MSPFAVVGILAGLAACAWLVIVLENGLALVALLLWVLTVLASVAYVQGNPSAANGIVGAGAGAILFTACAWWDRA